MPPGSSSPICERSLDLTLIGIGRRDIPQCSSKHFHMEAFYQTFSGGQRPRAPRPTRFSRESKATAVDIDQARAEVGRRIEKGTEQGKPFLRVVVPTPREPKPEQVIDLSFLY